MKGTSRLHSGDSFRCVQAGEWTEKVIASAGETETSLAMHTPILHAIIDGDAEQARAAMRAHMDRATRRLYATIAADSIESFSQKT
ncbi:hypothetical protein StoSoilB5_19400 [Arthrobacter sp. StoSoilB5]|nr:hypothetical protein StoSoilB5_19400 [Arthrobacter sp. StoSoilB5]